MGPAVKPRRDPAPDSDNPQHEQIIRLREELDMCAMKIAQLQARLIVTLDELDSQRNAHQREVNTERRAKEKLSRKLDGYLDEVTRAERERDDMRELVSILVEKALMLLFLPSLQWKAAIISENTQNPAVDDRDHVRAAVVALLRKRLAEEQGAHARTKQETDAEILRLRAMIARRDAELEACATHDAHRVLLSSSVPSDVQSSWSCNRPSCANGRAAHITGSVLPGHHHATALGSRFAEADSILARTTSRNRMLEREVDLLRQTVHQAHHSQSSDAKRMDVKGHQLPGPEKHRVSVQVQTTDPVHGSEVQYTLPPSPGLLPYTISRSPSPYALASRQARTPVPTHSAPQGIPFAQDEAVPTPGADVEHLKRDVAALALNIDDFVVERAAMKAMLARELPKAFSTASHTPSDRALALESVTHVAGECARERQELREQVNAMTRERARLEQELQTEIASLRLALVDLRHDQTARPPPQCESQPAGQRLLPAGSLEVPSALSRRVSPTLVPNDARAPRFDKADADGPRAFGSHWEEAGHLRINAPEQPEDAHELGEQSMDIATPLQTNTILSLREDDWPTPPSDYPARAPADVDPAEIPLPTSPDIEANPAAPPRALSPLWTPASFAPPPSSPSPPPLYMAPPHVPLDLLARIESATQERVASIEREIAATHRELEDREAALANIRARLPDQPNARGPIL